MDTDSGVVAKEEMNEPGDDEQQDFDMKTQKALEEMDVHNLGFSPTPSKQPTEKQCPICEYKSSQKAVLDNHIRIVHLELQ